MQHLGTGQSSKALIYLMDAVQIALRRFSGGAIMAGRDRREFGNGFRSCHIARLQFAFVVTFHIIFPTFTIGLSAYIAVLGLLWVRTGRERFHSLMRFWTRIFAVSFAMGVVSGIVMSYSSALNWSHFSQVVGNVVGPLIGYEVLTAFFLEATFLGVLLFGFNRVPPWLYVLSGFFVAGGTAFSAFWILSANSWMQTPAGFVMQNGIAYPTDWLAAIFNPSFPYRFAHMVNAAYLTTGFVVLGVGARYLLAGAHVEQSRTMLRMAIGLTVILAPLQLVIGDLHGLNTLEHQPIKVAAMEGHWDSNQAGVPFEIFAWPNEKTESNDYSIAIPHASSLILTHSWDGKFEGLKSVPPQGPSAGADRVLRLPRHGRARPADDRGRLHRRLPVVARHGVRDALVSLAGVEVLVGRLHLGDRRLDHHRGRTPAMDRGRRAAHRRRQIAGAGRQHPDNADPVRARLRHRVLVRHLLHQPPDQPGAGNTVGTAR